MSSKPCRPNSGFTLLELLVAVAILAVIGVASYKLLASTIATRDRAMEHDQGLMQLQRAMETMQRDIEQTAPRPIRDEFGDKQPALYFPASNTMDLTRTGWRNPMGDPRSDMVRVRYVLEGGRLRRYYWDALDRMPGAQPHGSDLLDHVTDFHLRAMDSSSGNWSDSWPLVAQTAKQQSNDEAPLPTAIEVTFTMAPYGALRRVFRVVEGGNASTTN
jgi:general secretion pathway protein J